MALPALLTGGVPAFAALRGKFERGDAGDEWPDCWRELVEGHGLSQEWDAAQQWIAQRVEQTELAGGTPLDAQKLLARDFAAEKQRLYQSRGAFTGQKRRTREREAKHAVKEQKRRRQGK